MVPLKGVDLKKAAADPFRAIPDTSWSLVYLISTVTSPPESVSALIMTAVEVMVPVAGVVGVPDTVKL